MNDAVVDHASLDEDPTPLPWWRFALVGSFVGLVALSNIANGVWAKWVQTHPARLLALSARVRYLLFTRVAGIDAISYVVIGFMRIAVAAFVCYGIGYVYEGRALRWFRRFLGMTPEGIENLQRGFAKAGWALIPFFVGSNIVCALAGLNRVRIRVFAPLLALGIAGRLALYWFLAEPFEKPLKSFIDFTQRHQVKFIIGSVALVVLVNVRNFRRGEG